MKPSEAAKIGTLVKMNWLACPECDGRQVEVEEDYIHCKTCANKTKLTIWDTTVSDV